MAILKKEDQPVKKREIDLTGPDGNVFFLMGTAAQWAKQMGLDDAEIMRDMMSGDYEHAVEVFDKHFDVVITNDDLQKAFLESEKIVSRFLRK